MTEMNKAQDAENQVEEPVQENSVEEEVLSPEDQMQQDHAELQDEMAKLKDQLLRALAETENVRRRSQKEQEDMAKYATANLARDLLSVSDNLRRALESVSEDDISQNEILKGLCEGVSIVEKELLGAFDKHGIKKINPLGERFDHKYHQAMMEQPDTGKEPGTVVQVMQEGYTIHDRLLRPAMVAVAK